MKRKVALFVNGWNADNVDIFLYGFNSYFKNNEMDLFVFTSYATNIVSTATHNAEDSIYSMPIGKADR